MGGGASRRRRREREEREEREKREHQHEEIARRLREEQAKKDEQLLRMMVAERTAIEERIETGLAQLVQQKLPPSELAIVEQNVASLIDHQNAMNERIRLLLAKLVQAGREWRNRSGAETESMMQRSQQTELQRTIQEDAEARKRFGLNKARFEQIKNNLNRGGRNKRNIKHFVNASKEFLSGAQIWSLVQKRRQELAESKADGLGCHPGQEWIAPYASPSLATAIKLIS